MTDDHNIQDQNLSSQSASARQTEPGENPTNSPLSGNGDDAFLALQQENTRLVEQLQRERADFVNYKKRVEEERKSWVMMGEEQVVMLFLPLYENIRRALQSLPEDIAANAWIQGIIQIEKQFMELIKRLEVELIPTLGAPFNPDRHDALLQVDGPEGKIIQELEPGYMRKEKILKPAKVSIGKNN